MNEQKTLVESNERKKWIEPEVRQLDVRETSTQPGRGLDGQKRYADCTLS